MNNPQRQTSRVDGAIDPVRIRGDFPILNSQVNGKPLVYFDNAATSQKPWTVIEAIRGFYENDNANVSRGVHSLSERATMRYEAARNTVAEFINAPSANEIIFLRGTTEAVNLVASSFGALRVQTGDEVIVSEMEHHSNLTPWQELCASRSATLKILPIAGGGQLDLEGFEQLLNARTRLVAITHVSNVLGTINPIRLIVDLAHRHNVPVFVDGAQAAPHLSVDVQELGCDFYAFSGHKAYGPTGIGVLFGRAELLDEMKPWQSGGGMIREVGLRGASYRDSPHKFEAGTPDIAGAIGLAAALDYLNELGMNRVAAYERELSRYCEHALQRIPRVRVLESLTEKSGILSFVVAGVHSHDLGSFLDDEGIAIRSGHHCAQPLIERLGLGPTARVSFSFYNLREEIDLLHEALNRAIALFHSN